MNLAGNEFFGRAPDDDPLPDPKSLDPAKLKDLEAHLLALAKARSTWASRNRAYLAGKAALDDVTEASRRISDWERVVFEIATELGIVDLQYHSPSDAKQRIGRLSRLIANVGSLQALKRENAARSGF